MIGRDFVEATHPLSRLIASFCLTHRRPDQARPRPAAVAGGVFFVAAATLMYEILLTRIFSVTMWYHFAFLAVAAALFGMTAGAVIVQVGPRALRAATPDAVLALSALAFAAGVPITFVAHLAIPVSPSLTPAGLASVLLTYAIVAAPFVASGVCVCLALTGSFGRVGTIYAADLAGAALGCLATVAVLRVVDAPAAVLLAASLGGLGAIVFARAAHRPSLLLASLAITGLPALVAAAQPSWLRITWVKGMAETTPAIYERWNSYSRIRIAGDPDRPEPPFGWGLSAVFPADRRVRQLLLSIDGIADTPLTRFDGRLDAVEHLRYDVTNLVHELRPDARVLVVGAGGGRDVLAALAFGQREVVAVEMNEAILDAVNRRLGEFTGHLDRRPGVSFVNDEARSWVARQPGGFGVIQVSFIDTFAATAAGAYVLTEHSLYTVEAWRTFLERLAPDGILTFSRWYFHRAPAEIRRLVALATASLADAGVARTRAHLILVGTRSSIDPRYGAELGVGTLLVGRRPFTAAEIALVRQAASRLRFDVVLDPERAADPVMAALASPDTLPAAVAQSPLDISPPTDDRPFFFHTLRLGSALKLVGAEQGNVSFNLAAVLVLVGALTVAAALTAVYLTVSGGGGRGGTTVAERTFFVAIGLGYILIEMSQLHRLAVFLGHPTPALTVALFSLLLASGVGSFAVRRWPRSPAAWAPLRPLIALPVVLVVVGLIAPAVVTGFRGLVTPGRIVVAVALLAPMGFVMGMAFPRGLDLARRRSASSGPWLWAVNGAASVLGSLIAVLVSISAGVSATFWSGVVAYVVAVCAAWRMSRASPRAS